MEALLAQIDSEASAARAELEAQVYDLKLLPREEEKLQPKRDRLAEAKAGLEQAIAAVPVAEAAAAAARRKRQQADEAVAHAQAWFKLKPEMGDEEWQARMERCQELQTIQLERLEAESDAESKFREAEGEVGWARELVRRAE